MQGFISPVSNANGLVTRGCLSSEPTQSGNCDSCSMTYEAIQQNNINYLHHRSSANPKRTEKTIKRSYPAQPVQTIISTAYLQEQHTRGQKQHSNLSHTYPHQLRATSTVNPVTSGALNLTCSKPDKSGKFSGLSNKFRASLCPHSQTSQSPSGFLLATSSNEASSCPATSFSEPRIPLRQNYTCTEKQDWSLKALPQMAHKSYLPVEKSKNPILKPAVESRQQGPLRQLRAHKEAGPRQSADMNWLNHNDRCFAVLSPNSLQCQSQMGLYQADKNSESERPRENEYLLSGTRTKVRGAKRLPTPPPTAPKPKNRLRSG
ncbi:unnamed protein product [Protopolystoma xenopodis]|uniref:Uncharacterized protein n=1 Tax=Protopolystoma xenopodis TaxID=117903 RepID=A0A448WJ14_9PLAT|nr:unnamed protein product [Protopolystoma xenopodis]